jgi:ABC-type phosphate transport system substrate-binding protein
VANQLGMPQPDLARASSINVQEDALRLIKSLIAVGAVAATATALAVAPAMADPVNSHYRNVSPAPYDVVGVGAGTTQYLFDQLSVDYNAQVEAKHKHSPSNPAIYSWDATPPAHPLDETSQIVAKRGCAREARPNGSSPGIKALSSGATVKYKGHTYPCNDFARSSRPRGSSDPAFGAGGIAFVALATDAVTYATTANSNVPDNLTRAQLQEIYGCDIPAANGFAENTWGALLGPTAKDPNGNPDPITPQVGSGTLSFWMETALGFPGDAQPTCSSEAATAASDPEGVPEENEGISPAFLTSVGGKNVPNPNVLFPYSIGSWVAQEYHSKACNKLPKKGQNNFGCDENGVLFLNGIAGTAPLVTAKGVTSLNPRFSSFFRRTLWDVVPFNTVAKPISPRLAKFFGPKGWFCNKKERSIIEDYGFLPTPMCGDAF